MSVFMIVRINCIHNHDEFPLMPWDASLPPLDIECTHLRLVSSGCSPGHCRFYYLHIHQMAHEYWWPDCGRSGCPVAAGHCGKLAASLIVIHRPSSVSIKIRKGDTLGAPVAPNMYAWRDGGRKSERLPVCEWVCVCTSRATRPLRCHGNLYHQNTGG